MYKILIKNGLEKALLINLLSGGVWESNPPIPIYRDTPGFEGREGHRSLFTSHIFFNLVNRKVFFTLFLKDVHKGGHIFVERKHFCRPGE